MNKRTSLPMKKLFFSAFVAGSLALVSTQANAQQLPLYSQSYFDPFLYNPAMTGITGGTNANLIHRSQWTGMPGGPVTNAFSVDGFMEDKNVGLGMVIFNDKQDINERLGIYADYAYRLKLNDDMQLRFGLSLGFLDNRIDFSNAIVKDANDPMMFAQMQRKSGLDANLGVTYNWKDLRVGISVPQLLGQKLEYANYDTRSYYQLNRHYLGTVSYKYVFNEDQMLAIEPMAMVRWVPGSPFQYDVNVMGSWKDMVWLGASYRSNYAVGINARVKLFGNLSAGYAYDLILTPLKTSAGISHEFMLGYRFGAMQSAAPSGGNHQRGKYD